MVARMRRFFMHSSGSPDPQGRGAIGYTTGSPKANGIIIICDFSNSPTAFLWRFFLCARLRIAKPPAVRSQRLQTPENKTRGYTNAKIFFYVYRHHVCHDFHNAKYNLKGEKNGKVCTQRKTQNSSNNRYDYIVFADACVW